jgi:hypothetical protein
VREFEVDERYRGEEIEKPDMRRDFGLFADWRADKIFAETIKNVLNIHKRCWKFERWYRNRRRLLMFGEICGISKRFRSDVSTGN